MSKPLVINHEVLSMFCNKCKCCLVKNGHCGVCHSSLSVNDLCGCGNCEARLQDYLDREVIRERLVAERRALRNAT